MVPTSPRFRGRTWHSTGAIPGGKFIAQQPGRRGRPSSGRRAASRSFHRTRSGWEPTRSPGGLPALHGHATSSSGSRPDDLLKVTDDNQADAITAPSSLYDPTFTFQFGEDAQLPAITIQPVRRQAVHQVDQRTHRAVLSPADRDRVGIRLPSRHDHRVLLWKRSCEARSTAGSTTTRANAPTRSGRRSPIHGAPRHARQRRRMGARRLQ